MPDRDNTFHAFTYNQDGTVVPSSSLNAKQRTLAEETLRLLGFDRRGNRRVSKNGKLVRGDRIDDRLQAYGRIAQLAIDLIANNTPHERERILWQAEKLGFFSLWMTLFQDVEIRKEFIALFNAATDCFDPVTTASITPRPRNPHLDPSGRT